MKKLSILCLAVSLLLTASCSKEELSNGMGDLYTLTGVVEGNTPTTRVGFDLDNNGSFFWNSGDAIAVGASSFAKYTTSCDDKSTSATFTSLSPASGYAVYPWERAQSISGSELTYEFEDEYTYETVDTDFFNGMSVDMPMWAKVEGGTLSFKHLGGVFAFKFPNLKAGNNQVFTLTANSKISGVFTADLSDDEPIFETSTENVQDADKKVAINFSLESDADAVFYVPVPVGTYALKVEITNGEASYSQEYKNLAVARRSIRYTTLSSHSLQGAEAKVVESASEVTSAMEENTNVVLNEIESQNANSTVSIELPKKSENSEVAHSLSIGSIDDNTETIEIKESDSDNEGSSISELVISVPTTEDAKKLVIDMPNTTVSILVNGMSSLTLDEVTASTAESTLIVSKGVTINTLKVKQGNVRIEDGGKITKIERAAENTEIVYVVYESGTAPTVEIGEGVVLMSAAEWDLRKAAVDGGEVKLSSDVALTTPLTISSTMTIDLNSNTLSYTSATMNESMITNNGILTIKNGTVTYNYTGEADTSHSKGNYAINNAGTLTIEANINAVAGTIGQKFSHAFYAINTSGKTIINSGKILNNTNYAIRQWVSSEDKSSDIIVDGGEIEGLRAIWIQLPNSDKTKAPKANLTVKKGTLRGTAIDGTQDSGNVLAIYATSQGNQMKNVEINIEDGDFYGDLHLTGGRIGAKVDVEKVTITGGTFHAGDNAPYVYSVCSWADDALAAQSITIKKGTFSHLYPLKYMEGDNGNINVTLAKDLKVGDTEDDDMGGPILIPSGNKVTLDLNGKAISQTSDTPVSMITNNGNLTIKDSSNGSGKINFTFNGTVNNGVAANAISNRGALVVEGGEISNTGTGNQIGYAIDNYNGSTLTVNGGKITASGSSYYDGIRLFCGNNQTTVTVNKGEISTIWAQNPSANKATEVYGTVIINGGTVGTTYYENYTTVKVKSGLTTTVTPYGEGSNDTMTTTEGEYIVYYFVQE